MGNSQILYVHFLLNIFFSLTSTASETQCWLVMNFMSFVISKLHVINLETEVPV